jgi:hypothetical protein
MSIEVVPNKIVSKNTLTRIQVLQIEIFQKRQVRVYTFHHRFSSGAAGVPAAISPHCRAKYFSHPFSPYHRGCYTISNKRLHYFVSKTREDQGASITKASNANPIIAKDCPQGVGAPVSWYTPQVATKLAK